MTKNEPLPPALSEFAQYAEQAGNTIAAATEHLVLNPSTSDIIHGILGASGEVGELADQLKRHLYYKTDLDLVNLMEEVGDVLWYLNLIAVGGGFTLQQSAEANIRKLRIRYAGKFNATAAINRDIEAERAALGGVIADAVR